MNPTAGHYKKAELELRTWESNGGLPATDTRIDMHVIGQLSEYTYSQLDRMAFRTYAPLLEELHLATLMPPVRVNGLGPWTLWHCECCVDVCGLICFCGRECSCDGKMLGSFREFMTADLHVTALNRQVVDIHSRVAMLTGMSAGDVADMPYGDFRLVNMAIERSLTDPFWPLAEHRAPSITGVMPNE